MRPKRPDLSQSNPELRTYIEALEAEIERLQQGKRQTPAKEAPPPEPGEAPTPFNLVTISAAGMIKRTPRHLYTRQRRGGMGIFDLKTPEDDPPVILSIADESQYLFLLTDRARTFRLRLNRLAESPIRSRGRALSELLPLHADERPVLVLPEQTEGYVIIITQKGYARRIRHHYFGENLRSGLVLFDVKTLGEPAAGCWSAGESDLFIATRQGRAIRFAEKQIPVRGCLGIRLAQGDAPAAVAPISADGGVFLLSADGKGSIRQMSGFSANKAPGSGGKTALKTNNLVGAVAVSNSDDLFIASRLGKLIRFQAAEIPPKTGAVQGVNCMTLRSDETTALVSCG